MTNALLASSVSGVFYLYIYKCESDWRISMVKYKNFFEHIKRRVEKKNKKRASENLIRNASEKLAERLDISTVEALSLIQEKVGENPKSVIREWMKAKEENKKPLDGGRFKDKATKPMRQPLETA